MKKVYWLFPIILFFMLIVPVKAQMMGFPTASPNEQTKTQQEEAQGKTIWDKLQNKQVTCKDLKDDDFELLGDFFMGSMMGSNHASMDAVMDQRLGENGNKQMHIAMAKRLSGCNSNASFPQGAGYFMPMMGFGGMMGGGWNQSWGGGGGGMMRFGGWNNMMGSSWGIFGGLTWLLVVVFLILGVIYFWKGISRQNK